MANIYQLHARDAKARKIADWLGAAKITADEIVLASEEQWAEIARAVGVRLPSAETREVVRQMLKDREMLSSDADQARPPQS